MKKIIEIIFKIFSFLLIFYFSFVLWYNITNADFTNKELWAINDNTLEDSLVQINANKWDIITIYTSWDNWYISHTDIWFNYLFNLTAWLIEINHWDLDLLSNWNIKVSNIWNYNFSTDFDVNTTYDTRNWNATIEFKPLKFKISDDFCWDEDIIVNWKYLYSNSTGSLIWEVKIVVQDKTTCLSTGSTLYASSPSLFYDLDLSSFNYNTIYLYDDNGNKIGANYTNQLNNITKLLYQLLIIVIIISFIGFTYVFYNFLNDLVWKK